MSGTDSTRPTTPEDPALAPWRLLREALAGSFSARARGLLGSEFALLDRDGEPFGALKLRGTEGADLEAGDLRAEIREVHAAPHSRYTMRSGDAQVLVAGPGASSGVLDITCGGRPYEARLGLLRNTAAARPVGEPGETAGEAARVTGGLTNRAYEAVFEVEDAGSLPVAVSLLYRIASLRRRAYRADARR